MRTEQNRTHPYYFFTQPRETEMTQYMKKFIKAGDTLIATQYIVAIKTKDDVGTRYDQGQWATYDYAHYYIIIKMVTGEIHNFKFNTKEEREIFVRENLTEGDDDGK